MQNSVKQRLNEIFEIKKINVNSIYKTINIPQKTLNNQINGKTEVSLKTILAISYYYNDISLEWLLKGTGKMLLKETTVTNTENSDWKTEKINFLQETSHLKDKIIELQNELFEIQKKSIKLSK